MNAGMTTMRQFAEINAAADNWHRNLSVLSLTQNPIPVRGRGLVVNVAALWDGEFGAVSGARLRGLEEGR